MGCKTPILLKDYNTTSKQKSFSIEFDDGDSSIYFGNVEKLDNVFDVKVRSNRFCLSSDVGILHNIYDSRKILFHGLAARRHRYPYTTRDDYQHIYRSIIDESLSTNLSNGLCAIVKAEDTLYGLDKPGIYGHYYVNDDMYSWLAQDNGYPIPKPLKYSTLLYNDNQLTATATPKIIKAQISGVMYNTLFEIPGNIYTDYASGSMFATTVKCKNHLNAEYSMIEKKDPEDSNSILSQTRQYLGIYSCNNQLYLQFKDVGRYDSSNRDNPDNYVVNYNGNQHVIKMYKAKQANDVEPTTKIPQVEYIQNINRGATPSNHKSSLYSLRLTAPDLEKLSTTDPSKVDQINRIKENIRQEVKNVIRSLAERIAPANAQLFAVTVNNK